MMTNRLLHSVALLLAFALLAACDDRQADAQRQGQSDATALPGPDASAGSVTGMPATPGPGEVPLAGEAPPPPESDQPRTDLFDPESGFLPGAAAQAVDGAPAAEPAEQDAVAVVRDYYASVDSDSYARAQALWADNGRASGQTPQQFADGFAQVAHISAEIGTPGEVDAGAGQRHIRIPVSVSATRTDGSQHRYVGSYTLQLSVVDGASAEQRAWRIAAADLRELEP